MSKKMKIVISVLAAIVLLTFSGAAVAMAQDETATDTETAAGGLLARVAQILGIGEDELVEAFLQAREECDGTGNCTLRQENSGGFQERFMEKRQEWVEKKQEQINKFQNRWTDKQQATRGGFQNGGQGNNGLRISEAVRSRQMIAVPNDWDGQLSGQSVNQIY